jgi:hypothetical protein
MIIVYCKDCRRWFYKQMMDTMPHSDYVDVYKWLKEGNTVKEISADRQPMIGDCVCDRNVKKREIVRILNKYVADPSEGFNSVINDLKALIE